MENMNLSNNHVYGIPPAISSLVPLVLSYCPTYFSIFPLVFSSWSTYFSILPKPFHHVFNQLHCVWHWRSSVFWLVSLFYHWFQTISRPISAFFHHWFQSSVKPVSAFFHWFSPIDQHMSASCQTVFQIYLSLAKAFVRLSSRFFGTFS